MIDLGAWASNQYRVAGPSLGDDGEHPDGGGAPGEDR